MSDRNIKDMEMMESLARQAGEVAMSYFKNHVKVWLKEGNSPVSAADLAVDKLVQQHLLQQRPDYGWISEETIDQRADFQYQRAFVIDPIDGTRGFIDGSDLWCISLAVIEDGQPVSGVLYAPARDEMWCACLGHGAWHNGQPMVDDRADLEAETNRVLRISAYRSFYKQVSPLISRPHKLINYIPSLALRIAFSAMDEIDCVFVRPNSHDWDLAAADLILRETGGVLLDATGKPIHYGQHSYQHDFLVAFSAREKHYSQSLLSQLANFIC